MTPQLSLRHLLLAVCVVAIWGTNFAVVKAGLAHFPPLLFATLRFAFVVVPALLFVPRPRVPWQDLAAYGVLTGAGLFGLLYLAIQGSISPGLASLVVQMQVFLTIALSMLLTRERLRSFQWVGLGLAAAGLGVIAMHTDASTTPLGLALVLLAALSWACANLIVRRSGQIDVLAYVVWASLFSLPPLAALSLAFEGPDAIVHGLRAADLPAWAALLWQSAGNTLFGNAVWAWLLTRYPTATIAPMALLVPVFGITASVWWLQEPLPPWKICAAALVLGGLAINLVWPRLRTRGAPADAAAGSRVKSSAR